MENKIKNVKNKIKSEKGLVIIEAAIVFPVMFFVLFFIIFIGNMYYEQAKIDEIVLRYAVKGAEGVADPFQFEMDKKGEIPTDSNSINIEPYRYVLGFVSAGGISQLEDKISEAVKKEISSGSLVFFKNSELNVIGSDNDKIAEFKNYVIYSTFVVQVNYTFKFPIKFIWEDYPTIIRLSSRAEVPVSDSPEFIRNVDMAVDFIGKTSIGNSIKGIFDKINEFILKFR